MYIYVYNHLSSRFFMILIFLNVPWKALNFLLCHGISSPTSCLESSFVSLPTSFSVSSWMNFFSMFIHNVIIGGSKAKSLRYFELFVDILRYLELTWNIFKHFELVWDILNFFKHLELTWILWNVFLWIRSPIVYKF